MILDSNRILEMGVKRDDGFSKLMASVVNDTSVMYNTYSGNGFHANDTSAIGHRIFAIGGKSSGTNSPNTTKKGSVAPKSQQPLSNVSHQRSAKDSLVANNLSTVTHQPSAKDSLASNKLSAANHQQLARDSLNLAAGNPSTVNPIPTAAVTVAAASKNQDKDSLLAARRQQLHIKDSLRTAHKAALKDSLAAMRMAKASKDSLQAVRKAFLKDSLMLAKKLAKDSLLAVKVRNDSLKREAKNLSAVTHQPTAVSTSATDAGGESRVLTAAGTQQATSPTGSGSGTPGNSNSGIIPSTVNHQPSAKALAAPKKIREVSLKISRKIVFLDFGPDGHIDTVTLFVYFESRDSLKRRTAAAPQLTKKLTQDTVVLNQAQLKPKMPDTAALNKSAVLNKSDTISAGKILAKNKPAKSVQPPCPDLASDADMLYLRTAILNANTDQEKIAVASGGFALKCFTVAQLRQLASIFVSDKTRYRLMEAARLHISDREHFPELADMYSDKNFQRKFLVMAENRS